MDDVDSRRIEEVTYLNTENTWRYRAIVHFCFRRHEHMQAYIYPEDIWQALQKQPQFKDYTQEQMDQDLSQLVAWHNLQAFQETGRALSIVDFKRKMLRYQCTPYTVEIERLVEKLKKIGNEFGGSLETTQFDRIRDSLEKLLQYEQADDKELYQNWQDLQHYFRTLVQNTSDYMAHLGSQRVQERMKTSEFIIYKDKFTQYLNSFVLGLQRSSLLLEKLFNQLEPEQELILFLRLAARQAEIQVTGAEFSQKECRDDFAESYEVMREWFLGREGRESELSHLIRETGETIRRITRFAQRLAEQHQAMRSRKSDLLYLAGRFAGMTEVDEAHVLGAALFGVQGVRHFYAEPRANEDDYDARIQDEPATPVELKPRVSTYRERSRQTPIHDRREEKQRQKAAYEAAQHRRQQMLESLVVEGEIDMASLPVLTREVRQVLLAWISRLLLKPAGIRTETGLQLKLVWDRHSRERVAVHSEDGTLYMPPMKLLVQREGGHEQRKGGGQA